MAGYSPVPLPSLSTLFDPAVSNFAGAPAPLPSIGLVMNPVTTKVLTAAVGSYALTGIAAALKEGYRLTSAAGSFALTGVAATLTYVSSGTGVSTAMYLPSMSLVMERAAGDKLLSAGVGTFVLTGNAAALGSGLAFSAAVGSYVLNGAPALRDMQVTSDKATFAMTGVASTLTRSTPTITASTGTFTLTGIAAGLTYETPTVKTMLADVGAFTLTGIAATMPTTIARLIVCDKATFALTCNAATLRYVGWAPVTDTSSTWTPVTATTTTWTNV